MKCLFIWIMFCVLSLVIGGPACSVEVSATPRVRATWSIGKLVKSLGVIYDINVTNTGICSLSSVGLLFYLPDGVIRLSSWNLEQGALYDSVITKGQPIRVGESVAAGIVLRVATLSDLDVQVYGLRCEPCDTQAPAQPTTPPPPPTTCAGINATATKTSSWMQTGSPGASYSLTISNNGNCTLIYYVTGFEIGSGTIVNTWNLESTLGGYQVTNYGAGLAPGESFSGAGFVVVNATSVALLPYGSACTCE